MNQHEQVNEFMAVMGQDMPASPIQPTAKVIELRQELIREENLELRNAADANDIIEIADALCDLQYVVSGAFTAYGFSPELSKELFDEVHRSNMSKACSSEEEANNTIAKYYKEGIEVDYKKVGEYWVISRVSDNKVLKSINYSAPDLKSILEKHGALACQS